jgi:hypothetical protein
MLAAAGCVAGAADAPEGYPVDAVAELAPLADESPRVAGPIEILGTGVTGSAADPGIRTVAAYRVQLPDDTAAYIAMISAASCVDREPLTAPDDPVAEQLLGTIRRVGDETHFFVDGVQIGDRAVDVDTETASAYLSRTVRFPRIVVAVSQFDFHVIACGPLTWR